MPPRASTPGTTTQVRAYARHVGRRAAPRATKPAAARLRAAIAAMSDEEWLDPEGFSWAYEDLHGHVRAHLAMIGPFAATVGWPPADREPGGSARGSRGPPTRGRADGAGAGGLTIEQIVAMESPREFRLQPRDRLVAYTAEAAGARQLFVLPLRGGYPIQLTASEKNVADPQWSPDGRRLAYVRDNEIRVIEADGSRDVAVTGHPAGVSSPRWSPDGRRLAFISRRRGWSQVWVVDAPVPRRGRPARDPRAARAAAGHGDRHRRRGPELVGRWTSDRRQRPARAGPRRQ